MSLNRDTLAASLTSVFQQSKDNQWDLPTVAGKLADAIHGYTSGADVTGIEGDVQGEPFSQSGKGKLS